MVGFRMARRRGREALPDGCERAISIGFSGLPSKEKRARAIADEFDMTFVGLMWKCYDLGIEKLVEQLKGAARAQPKIPGLSREPGMVDPSQNGDAPRSVPMRTRKTG